MTSESEVKHLRKNALRNKRGSKGKVPSPESSFAKSVSVSLIVHAHGFIVGQQ